MGEIDFEKLFVADTLQKCEIASKPLNFDNKKTTSVTQTIYTAAIDNVNKLKDHHPVQISFVAMIKFNDILVLDIIYHQVYELPNNVIESDRRKWALDWVKFAFRNLNKIVEINTRNTFLENQEIDYDSYMINGSVRNIVEERLKGMN